MFCHSVDDLGPLWWSGQALTCWPAESYRKGNTFTQLPFLLAWPFPCLSPLISRVKYRLLSAQNDSFHTYSCVYTCVHTNIPTLPFLSEMVSKLKTSSDRSSQNPLLFCCSWWLCRLPWQHVLSFLAFLVQSVLLIFCFQFFNFAAF